MTKIFIIIFLVFIKFNIFSNDLNHFKIFTSLNPTYVNKIGNSEKDADGIALEIVLAALKSAKIKFIYPEADIPWKRSQIDAQRTTNSILTPLTRTRDREKLYRWIELIFDDEVNIYSLPATKKIQNLDDLKKVNNIGVKASAGAYLTLIDLGIKDSQLDQIQTEEQNLEMILSGRHQYWAMQRLKEKKLIRDSKNPKAKKIKKLFTVQQAPLWVVTSNKTSDASFIKLKEAFAEFKKTSSYKKILKKYN